jgi:RNA polymerase sigma factor (sigma-70 family)
MTTGPTNRILTYLHRLAFLEERGIPDALLLERFLSRREEHAFAELVRRHGPLVLAVCRRVLGDAHDVADAFQATFLVLVRKAASIMPRARVGAWLQGVARRTALKARCRAARRRRAEQEAARLRPDTLPPADPGGDLRPLFDEEIGHLPEKYRTALVLCLIEGRSRKEAAGLLGWSEGTLSGRLARAKNLLGARLRRRGVALTGAALLAALADSTVAAEVPSELTLATVRLVMASAGAAGARAHPEPIVALAQEVMKTMLMSKVKALAGILGLVGALGLVAAAGVWQSSTNARGAAPQTGPYYEKGYEKSETPPEKEAARPVGDGTRTPATRQDTYVIEPPDILLVKYVPADGADPVKIEGQRLVRPDGTIALGQLGSVSVAGRTLADGRRAIADHLAHRLDGFDPMKLTVEVVASNSKVFYVIVDNADKSEMVYRFPVTGSETVQDALTNMRELTLIGLGQKDIWISRPSEGGRTSQVLSVDWKGITQNGQSATNYQLMSGDRVYIKNPAPKGALAGAAVDPIRGLETIAKALRVARTEDERQHLIDELEALTKALREQQDKR